MKILDVNVLAGAFRDDSPHHAFAVPIVTELVRSEERFGIPEMVLQSMVRVVTLLRINSSSTESVLDFCSKLRAAPSCEIVIPGERHWAIFDDLCRVSQARGNLVPDAYLAAFAIERSAIWLTFDADYKKFPGLIWQHLPGGQIRTNPR